MKPVKEDFGVMFYHRNRLIKAYEKLGCQRQVSVLLFTVRLNSASQQGFLLQLYNCQVIRCFSEIVQCERHGGAAFNTIVNNNEP